MKLLIAYAAGTILISFLCSILEAVLLSINKTFIKLKAKEDSSFAEKLQYLKDNIDEPLIIILTLNTIAHTVGAILVGVQAKYVYSELDSENTYMFFNLELTEELLVGIVSSIMTVLVLLVSEIIPKTLGAKYWQSLAKPSSIALNSIIPIFRYTGFLFVLKIFTRITGSSKKKKSFDREDINAIADIAEEEGVIKENESELIKNMVRLKKVKTKDIMTPFSVMETASENLTLEEYFENTDQFTFSRIPIYETNKENIVGYVLKDKILEEIINQNTNATLASISRKFIVFTTESKIPYVFDKLIKEREHISLIIDKKKEVKGIVTMEDIIETLLGYEIMDETDTIEDMQAYAKKRMQNMNL